MEQVAIISQEQKDLLLGQVCAPASHYNPFQDCEGNWLISIQEIQQTNNLNYLWVKDLPLIDWCAPIPNTSAIAENIS